MDAANPVIFVHPEDFGVKGTEIPSEFNALLNCAEICRILEIIRGTGAISLGFANPTCALCTAEHYGALPSGDIRCSTTNQNFISKVGKGSHTYLMSPMSAMATAVRGCITDPREILRQEGLV